MMMFQTDGIIKLISDEELRNKLGENSKQEILRFSIEKITGQWEELFNKVISEKK